MDGQWIGPSAFLLKNSKFDEIVGAKFDEIVGLGHSNRHVRPVNNPSTVAN